MKTFRILFVTMLSLVLLQRGTAAVTALSQESVPTFAKAKSSENLVKTVNHNGAYIPVVELPLIEIVSTKVGSHILATVFNNGKYMVEINLPEVEITAKQTGAKKMRFYIRDGETIVISDLPIIEIESEFPYNNLMAAIENENKTIPVVNLPEIIISPAVSENFILAAKIKDGILMPFINLPVVEITPEYSWLPATNDNKFAFENSEIEWIYISLKNCGITTENKIVCEVTSQIKSNVSVLPGTIRFIN